MAEDNEQVVRRGYKVAEDEDHAGWVAAFTDDGTFTDESIGVTWRGRGQVRQRPARWTTAASRVPLLTGGRVRSAASCGRPR